MSRNETWRSATRTRCVCGAAILAACWLSSVLILPAAAEQPDAYPWFNDFCVKHFGAEADEQTYAAFGKEFTFIEGGAWVYPSETSACVAFQTSLPVKALVEFGPTDKYDKQTSPAERNFYIHVHYLTGLKAGEEYHYRLVAEDERGNVIKSKDSAFKTVAPRDVIRVPDDLDGPPYVLDKSGGHYLLTKDIQVDGMAFDVPQKVENVTLDLGGHKVVYNEKAWPKIESGNFWDWIHGAKYGLRAMKSTGLQVYNGTIKQGAGRNSAQANSIGYNPMYLNGCIGMEIAGLTLDYSGPQQTAIYNHWGGSNSRFHHNVFVDRGTELINRHGAGCKAILLGGGGAENVTVDHNLVKRTRQSGLVGSQVFDNEVYVDSWATNSFGVSLLAGGKAHGNKVLGTGYHVVAFGWGTGQEFYRNFIHLEGTAAGGRFKEYGDQISLNGFRLTQYAGSSKEYKDNFYHDNTIIIRGREGCQGRGVQFFSDPYVENLRFIDNVIKAGVEDSQTKQLACVVTQGNANRTDSHLPIIYRGNTFISNVCNIRFGDYYGVGSNHHFYGCRFVRVGDDPRYKTFLWDTGYPCKKHIVRDPVFEGGAGLDSIHLGDGDHDLTVEWAVTAKAPPETKITVTDKTGTQVFSGNVGKQGAIQVVLGQYTQAPEGRVHLTPHAITAERDGNRTTTEITADGPDKKIELVLK